MLRALLAERFQLNVPQESRDLGVYNWGSIRRDPSWRKRQLPAFDAL
jgi:uncharacterized protein (TIGR03435 family)